MHELEERIGRLERENKRLKRWGVVGMLAVVGLALLGQAAPKGGVQDVVRTRLLEVVDDGGNARAGIRVGSHGPQLAFVDASGKQLVALGVAAGGPALMLQGASGEASVALAVSE